MTAAWSHGSGVESIHGKLLQSLQCAGMSHYQGKKLFEQCQQQMNSVLLSCSGILALVVTQADKTFDGDG
jgi:hypothetical protein